MVITSRGARATAGIYHAARPAATASPQRRMSSKLSEKAASAGSPLWVSQAILRRSDATGPISTKRVIRKGWTEIRLRLQIDKEASVRRKPEVNSQRCEAPAFQKRIRPIQAGKGASSHNVK